ncbi:MAG: hypothetical protein M3P26_10230 [Gemmatimonadota bacterium]|nr:hypothetical protein [Gemmatimonadota bacterium]
MAAPFRPRVLAIAAKIETTSGTDSVPTLASNALNLVGIPSLNLNYLETGVRDDVTTGVLGTVDRAAPAGRNVSFDMTLEVKGYGAAYSGANRPEADVPLRAGGRSATVVTTGGSESVTYLTLDDAMETATFYCWTANKLFKLVGCTAKMKFAAVVNQRAFFTFTVQGKLTTDPATTAFSAPTLNMTVPPIFNGAAANIGLWLTSSGEPLVIRSVGFDDGASVTERPSAGATDGLIGWIINDRKPRLEMDAEQVTLSTFDPYAASKQNSSGAIDTKPVFQVGSVQYNRMRFYGGRWALEAPDHGDVNNLSGWKLKGALVLGTESVGLRESRIVFD